MDITFVNVERIMNATMSHYIKTYITTLVKGTERDTIENPTRLIILSVYFKKEGLFELMECGIAPSPLPVPLSPHLGARLTTRCSAPF